MQSATTVAFNVIYFTTCVTAKRRKCKKKEKVCEIVYI